MVRSEKTQQVRSFEEEAEEYETGIRCFKEGSWRCKLRGRIDRHQEGVG